MRVSLDRAGRGLARLVGMSSLLWAIVTAADPPHATDPAQNATACLGAPDALTDELLGVFFDKACLVNATSNIVPCPLDAVAQFLDITCGENKVEAIIGSALGFLLLVMLLQMGGMPLPAGGTGTAMWALFMIVMLMQWSSVFCSLMMVFFGYANIQYWFHHCMIPLTEGIALMDAVGLATFFYQPVVLMKLLVMVIYAVAMAEGLKLYLACSGNGRKIGKAAVHRIFNADHGCFDTTWVCEHCSLENSIETSFCEDCGAVKPEDTAAYRQRVVSCTTCYRCGCGCRGLPWVLCWCGWCRKIANSGPDVHHAHLHRVMFFYFYVNPFFHIPLAANVVIWLLSMSFLFSIVFYAPMVISPGLVYLALFRLLQWFHDWLEAVTVDPQGGICAWLHAQAINSTRDSVWFVRRTEKSGLDDLLTAVLLLAFAAILFGPLLVYGTWTAVYAYSGHSMEENVDMVEFAYAYKYGIFLGIQWHFPAIEFNLQLAYEAFDALQGITDFSSFAPNHFMESSRALGALNFILSFVKPGISAVGICLNCYKYGDRSHKANIPFKISASFDDPAAIRGYLAGHISDEQHDCTTMSNAERYAIKTHWEILYDLPLAKTGNLEFMLEAVTIQEQTFKCASQELQEDRDFVLQAVKLHWHTLQWAGDVLKSDREFMLEAVKQRTGAVLQYASQELLADREFVLKAVKEDSAAFDHASEELKADRTFVLEAVTKNEAALQYVGDALKADKGIVLAAARHGGHAITFASEELKKNKDFMLQALHLDWHALQHASKELRNDREFMLEAVTQNSDALQYANDELKNDRAVVLGAVRRNGLVLRFAGEELISNREIVLEAVKQNGHALEQASEELRSDKEIVLAAVTQNGWALKCANAELRNDRTIMLSAVKQKGLVLRLASEVLKSDVEIVQEAVKQNRHALRYAGDLLMQDANFMAAVQQVIDEPKDDLEADAADAPEAKRSDVSIQMAVYPPDEASG